MSSRQHFDENSSDLRLYFTCNLIYISSYITVFHMYDIHTLIHTEYTHTHTHNLSNIRRSMTIQVQIS